MNLSTSFSQVAVLAAAGLLGAAAIIPYSLALQQNVTLTPVMVILSMVQSIIMLIGASILGLLSSRSLGLALKSEFSMLWIACLIGLAAGLVIIGAEKFVFSSHLPAALTESGKSGLPLWKRFLACFYGGITEEILMRWFLLSGILWLLTKVWHGQPGEFVVAAFWVVNIIVAVIFGIGHLPATKMLTELTPIVIIRAIVLNGIGGVCFGYVYLKYGLAAAMVSHYCADLVLHVIGPMFSRML